MKYLPYKNCMYQADFLAIDPWGSKYVEGVKNRIKELI
jgi:hypothetical protein